MKVRCEIMDKPSGRVRNLVEKPTTGKSLVSDIGATVRKGQW